MLDMLDNSIEAIELQLKSVRHQMTELRSKLALHKQNLQNAIVLNNGPKTKNLGKQSGTGHSK